MKYGGNFDAQQILACIYAVELHAHETSFHGGLCGRHAAISA